MPDDRITAYLSHSYRHEDREINQFFWRLFWANGVTFAVDPESEPLSIPYLELMMKRSGAFVGIVTRRPEQGTYQCSPFMVFEHGLAVQAQKPKLLFVESGVPKYFFPDGPETIYFSRQALPAIKGEAARRIATLARRSDASASAVGHGLGKVGLLVDEENDYKPMIYRIIKSLGFHPVDLNIRVTDTFRFALELDGLDFVVFDTHLAKLPAWLFPFISGRFIPTIKLRSKGAAKETHIAEPPWETGELLESVVKHEEIAVYYSTTHDLKSGLAAHVERLREERILFRSLSDGSRYFRSLGRRQGRIFISNAAEANGLCYELSSALKKESIRHFHDRYQNDIELADLWREKLPERVRDSQYFLPLITEHYKDSEFCLEEYRLAREQADAGEMKIVPYILTKSASFDIPEQGRDLNGLHIREQVRQIVTDLDELMTRS